MMCLRTSSLESSCLSDNKRDSIFVRLDSIYSTSFINNWSSLIIEPMRRFSSYSKAA